MNETGLEKILEDVVAEFKRLRLEKGFSHDKLATRAGVTRSAISHVESGRRKPSLLLCLKIAKALDIPLGSLVSEVEHRTVEESGYARVTVRERSGAGGSVVRSGRSGK